MRQLIALVALVATAACSMDTATTEPIVGSLAGAYTLRTMNGSPLPFTIVGRGDTTVHIDTDVILMTDGGDWNEKVNYRLSVGTAAAIDTSFTLLGTWSRVGNTVSFRIPGGPIYFGTASDTSMSLTDGAFRYLFVR
jgi:hypothetical protein